MSAKKKEDFTDLLAVQIPANKELAKSGKLNEAVENLLAIEKQTRQVADQGATIDVAVAIVQMCREANNWEALNSNVVLICKRRAQIKQVVVRVVQEAMTYLDETPSLEAKLELIENLRSVTAGKIHTELERARLTKILVKIKEDQGDVVGACDILQEVQVETYGAMEKQEKIEYILEQMRLCMDKKDFIRAAIIRGKIAIKVFNDGAFQPLKLRYYELVIRLATHEANYMEICKAYQAIYNTPSVQDDEAQWKEALKNVAIYLSLAVYDNEQSDIMNRIVLERKLHHLPLYKDILQQWLTPEIISWANFQATYEKELMAQPAFAGDTKDKRWKDLHTRVVEHNIRTMSKYYARIRTQRLADLLELTVDATESSVADMVTSKALYARIDRPEGIIVFIPPKDPNGILNDYADSISELLGLVEKTCHVINKEFMVHRITPANA